MFDITGKKIIVTGGSRGLGYAMAEALHKQGAIVLLVASNEKRLKAAAEKMGESGPRVLYTSGDLGSKEGVESIFCQAMALLNGELDVLVNAAGIQHRCEAIDFPLEQWEKILAVNLTAVFQLSQMAAKMMFEKGKGKIINIASMTSFFGSEMIPAYSASKGGIMQLTKALSNEWSGKGITVNAIAPGYMETELTATIEKKNPAQYEEIIRRIPMHRWGRPEDLQGIAVFLASDASNYISGAVIPVDGGYLGK